MDYTQIKETSVRAFAQKEGQDMVILFLRFLYLGTLCILGAGALFLQSPFSPGE